MIIRNVFIFLLSSTCLFSLQQEDPWVLLIKQYGQEKVLLRFPEDPILQVISEQKATLLESVSQGEKYLLKMQHREQKEKREIFDQILLKIENSKELALLETKEKDSSNKTYIDTKVLTPDDMYIESRTFLTKEHIFTLESHSPKEKVSSHKDFINSFKIVS